jgi:alpha-L-fucosidase
LARNSASRALADHQVPAWWRDAKLGIFVHWTPASVPGYAPTDNDIGDLLAQNHPAAFAWSPYTEWYENSLRFRDSPAAQFHALNYDGVPYRTFASRWEEALSQWDPEAWVRSFVAAGAQYVVLVAKHHDGWCLWPTKVDNPRRVDWASRRDVVGELADIVRSAGLRFGLYYSGGLDWTFNDHPIGRFSDLVTAQPTGDYAEYAEAQVRELIDLYRPSVLWNDISWPTRARGLAGLLSDYYKLVPDGVVNDRFMPRSALWRIAGLAPMRRLIDTTVSRAARRQRGLIPPKPPFFDVRTPEYTSFDTVQSTPWESVRGMDKSFGFNRNSSESDFLSQADLLWSFADIVAKGGNLLLNVGPRGEDAQIPDAQNRRLAWMAGFMAAGGAQLQGTRPWLVPGTTTPEAEVRFAERGGDLVVVARALAGDRPPHHLTIPHVASLSAARDSGGRTLDTRTTEAGVVIELADPCTVEDPVVLVLSGVRPRAVSVITGDSARPATS